LKKLLASCGRSLGWRSMSGNSSMGGRRLMSPRLPATTMMAMTVTPKTSRKYLISVPHFLDVLAASIGEQLADFSVTEFRVGRLDGEEELVMRGLLEAVAA